MDCHKVHRPFFMSSFIFTAIFFLFCRYFFLAHILEFVSYRVEQKICGEFEEIAFSIPINKNMK